MSRERHRLPNWAVGLIAIALTFYSFLYAFTGWVPFQGKPYEIKAVFTSGQSLRDGSPVRIAGVGVGKVTAVSHIDPATVPGSGPARDLPRTAALLTMELHNKARPIKTDATLQIRPRLFLEGNFFVDLRPGSPAAPEAPDGHVFPLARTSNTVQLTDVQLTVQKAVRDRLRTAFAELGPALSDYGGSAALRRILKGSPGTFRDVSETLAATLGRGPDDLSGTIRNTSAITTTLARHQRELSDLVANSAAVAGAVAANDKGLERAVGELPATIDAAHPALARVNALFPPLRSFARASLPGVRALGPAADAAIPFALQLEGLVSRPELAGLTADLRRRVPLLGLLVQRSIPLLQAFRDTSSCQNEIFIPFAHGKVPDVNAASEPSDEFYREFAYSLTGVSGEGRVGDANGQYSSTQAALGPNSAILGPIPGLDQNIGLSPFKLLGYEPALHDSLKTPFRPKEPCDRQQLPNLGATVAAPPQTQTTLPLSRVRRPAPAGASRAAVRRELFGSWRTALRKIEGGSGR